MRTHLITGHAFALMLDNVDTDQICPARFLHTPRAEGYAEMAFHDVRSDPEAFDGFLDPDNGSGPAILLAGENFGCGSSREQAVWALYDLGVRAILAGSFGDIFKNNCANNGILTAELRHQDLTELADLVRHYPRSLSVDGRRARIELPDRKVRFDITPLARRRLIDDVDAFSETAHYANGIAEFRQKHAQVNPWLFQDLDRTGDTV